MTQLFMSVALIRADWDYRLKKFGGSHIPNLLNVKMTSAPRFTVKITSAHWFTLKMPCPRYRNKVYLLWF